MSTTINGTTNTTIIGGPNSTVPNGNWTPPADSTNSITIPKYGTGISVGGQGNTCLASTEIKAKITATWIGSPDNTTDPPPPSVIYTSSATAHANTITTGGVITTGQVSNGLNDPIIKGGVQIGQNTEYGVMQTPNTLPLAHFTPQSGGSFTINLDITNSATGAGYPPLFVFGFPFDPGVAQVDVGLDSYTVSIHPQPYGFNQLAGSPTIDNTTGDLHFYWNWLSTDGSVADLKDCSLYEYITWSGDGTQGTTPDGRPAFFLPNPPVGPLPGGFPYGYDSPTIHPSANSYGSATQGTADDDFKAPSTIISPCTGPTVTWTGTQNYYFDDQATGQTKVPVPSVSTSYVSATIVRSITKRTNVQWKYSCTSRGYTATINPLP